jgi:hypothetical protein
LLEPEQALCQSHRLKPVTIRIAPKREATYLLP